MSVSLVLLTSLSVATVFKLNSGQAQYFQIAFLTGAWCLISERSDSRPFEFISVGILAGVSVLAKVNDGAINLAIFYIILAARLWQLKALTWLFVLAGFAPLIAFCTAFQLSNGSLGLAFKYLRAAALIGAGYSEGMSIVGPGWQACIEQPRSSSFNSIDQLKSH